MKMTLLLFALSAALLAQTSAPPPEAFHVLPELTPGPRITPYLKYQTELAWQQDDLRRQSWARIHTEPDLSHLQSELRRKLLLALGGLPETKTPLNPRITGRISGHGFHTEKLIYESLPGVYVTALLYVPEDGHAKHPAILVPAGHAANGKVHYQALSQRLVQRGYVVIAWDPVGQGERSQFWDAKAHKSRYNLICAEHAVLGNLAYLAGTSLARWEIWDGIRAVDYLVTRPEVDVERISITGTSGGGFQTALIAALEPRIKVAAISCYITALPMRVYNRIFQDPDSDPEQDLNGMIADGLDHPSLLLLMYPRPVFVASAVLDFFPIEGAHKSFREAASLYAQFHHADRIAMTEGYHAHQFSDENQEAALNFLDHFNQMPARQGLPPVQELDEKTLQTTESGQAMLDFKDARSLMDVIRDYYVEHKQNAEPRATLSQLYYDSTYPGIKTWGIAQDDGLPSEPGQMKWEPAGSTEFNGMVVDRYIVHYDHYLEMPILHVHKREGTGQRVLLWFTSHGKATAEDWPKVRQFIDDNYDVVSFDFRGIGETRMQYKAVSEDDPSLSRIDFDRAYVNPLSSVLADYVYNSLLTGRPYFLQMIEDAEIAVRFSREKLKATSVLVGAESDPTVANAIAETLSGVKLLPGPDAKPIRWSELVDERQELWPIQYLLPGGAFIH
jgi:hypothetical protein